MGSTAVVGRRAVPLGEAASDVAADLRAAVVRHDVFAFLWAAANVFHTWGLSGWRWDHALGWAYAALTVAVLLRPGSPRLFAALVAVDLAGLAYSAPRHPNHIFFSGFVGVAVLAALIPGIIRRRAADDLKTSAIANYGPAVRVSLLLLYFWAVFHKLNSSYFDPAVSSSAQMYRDLAEVLPVLPRGPFFATAAIYVVIAMEFAIPLLLALRRTAVAGAFVGIAFHFLLAINPRPGVFSFSATLLPLFWLFLPTERIASFALPSWTRRAARFAAIAAGVAYVTTQFLRSARGAGDGAEEFRPPVDAGLALWIAYAVVVTSLLVWNLRRTRGAAPMRVGLRPASAAFAVIPLLVAVNGACPYLGLKTESSFSMFSNLCTECDRSNHFLVPSSVQVTDWMRDTVEIVDSTNPALNHLRDDRYASTYLQLRILRTRERRRFAVTFVRGGRTLVFDSDRPETHDVLPPVPWIATKVCHFRPVDLDDRVRARH